MISDPHGSLRDRVLDIVLKGEGDSDPEIRQAAAEGTNLPPDLKELVDKIQRHAYRVSDEDVAKLQAKYGDDRMFEIIVSAALGASRHRLFAALEALDRA